MFTPKEAIIRNVLDILIHLIITIAISLYAYFKFDCISCVVFSFLGGILVDMDHFIDYFLYYRRFNLKSFFSLEFVKSGKVYVLFHSWELTLLFLLAGTVTQSKPVLFFAISLAAHLLIDHVQKSNALFYFLTYRIIKKFDITAIFPEWKA